MSLTIQEWRKVYEEDFCRRVKVVEVTYYDETDGNITKGIVLPIVDVSVEDGYVYVLTEQSARYPMYPSQIEPYLTDVRLDVPVNPHYQTSVQPIETMQANMTREELIGFLKGNIIKYVCRCGRKDDVPKETAKIKQYAVWLDDVANGKEIKVEHKEDK